MLDLNPPAPAAQRRVAWTVIAHTSFERGAFDAAEHGYAEVLALVPEKDPARNELTVAYELKPTVILEGTGGWSSRIRDVAYDGKHLEEAKIAELHFAQTPEEAVDMAFELSARRASGRDPAREYR